MIEVLQLTCIASQVVVAAEGASDTSMTPLPAPGVSPLDAVGYRIW
jgi:hypothetical protein